MEKANPDVLINCVSKEGKFETLSCSDRAGNKMSQSTGNEKKLIKWVKSKKCQISTECKSIEKVQGKNTDVEVICVNDLGKTKVMSCVGKDGTILSTENGKIKDLIKWVQSNKCNPDTDATRKVKFY